jgi:5-methylcytosine-specific restriction protein A
VSPRSTGFPPEVRQLVRIRSGGRCECCGLPATDMALHHRRTRGMGSTRRADTNTASNAFNACGSCHRLIESCRTQSYFNGWLVRQTKSPLTTAVLYRGEWRLIDDQGYTYRIPTPIGGVA